MEKLLKSKDIEESNVISCAFPFLGSLIDGEPFQYLLLSVQNEIIEIAILDWLVLRAKLHKGNKVNLHLPEILGKKFQFTYKMADTVISDRACVGMKGKIYGISVKDDIQKSSLKAITLNDIAKDLSKSLPLVEQLNLLIKDSMILKQGIEVYLKHLVPYFSRIVNYTSDEYTEIKKHFFMDVLRHVQNNVAKFANLHETVKSNLNKIDEIPVYIDLESLREILVTEISRDLFIVIFSDIRTLSMEQLLAYNANDAFAKFINAIKTLENRLYSNYNEIVTIYLSSLEPS